MMSLLFTTTKMEEFVEATHYVVLIVSLTLLIEIVETLVSNLLHLRHVICYCDALVIMKHPDDPNKTKFALVAHANPGGDIPQWACKTAVNAIAPIEPFKLFHKINSNVKRASPQLQVHRTEMVGSLSGRSSKPAGLSQMGYACFWPQGGGLREGFTPLSQTDQDELTHDEDETKKEGHNDDE
jgi:hypothetical protein